MKMIFAIFFSPFLFVGNKNAVIFAQPNTINNIHKTHCCLLNDDEFYFSSRPERNARNLGAHRVRIVLTIGAGD